MTPNSDGLMLVHVEKKLIGENWTLS